eukprot:5500253-Amphidinium_carterae.1
MSNNEHLIWLEKQKSNVSSPVYGWKDSLVLQAIQNLINNRSLAHKEREHPFVVLAAKTEPGCCQSPPLQDSCTP